MVNLGGTFPVGHEESEAWLVCWACRFEMRMMMRERGWLGSSDQVRLSQAGVRKKVGDRASESELPRTRDGPETLSMRRGQETNRYVNQIVVGGGGGGGGKWAVDFCAVWLLAREPWAWACLMGPPWSRDAEP